MKNIVAILLILSVALSACSAPSPVMTPETTPSPTATQIPFTPIPKIYTLRMEFSTTSDWSTLSILDPASVVSVSLVDKQGNFENYSVDAKNVSISQPTAPVLNNPNIEIKITVDFVIADNGSNTAIPFHLEKGAVNNTTIRFFNISDNKSYLLLDEIVREGYVEGHNDVNPYNFSLDLKSLFQDVASLPTPTAIPTVALPVSQRTPVPASNAKITADNVKDLQEIARYYGQINYFAKLTTDNKFLFILDPDGLTKYDYASMQVVTYISLPNSVSDLQISNDGIWLMVDGTWLINLKNDKEPVTYVLSEKLDLINFYAKSFALSPDGSVIIVAEVRCYDTCNNKFQIVSTENFEVLHVSSGINYLGVPTFSPDGKYFALAEMMIEAHPDGSTNPTGTSVGVWTVKDFSKIKSFTVKNPFDVTSVAFSEDDRLIAIAHLNAIDLYDLTSDNAEPYQITDLCGSYERKILFAPVSLSKLVQNSDCSSGSWVVSGNSTNSSAGNVPDLSKVAFDEKGNPSVIPYPQPTTDFNSYQWYSFYFPKNDTLSFRDLNSVEGKTCDLTLAEGSVGCQPGNAGKGRIRATNGDYYTYLADSKKVDIYSADNSSKVYFSIPFTGLLVQLLALDPINDVIYYNIALSTNINRIVIQDMTNKDILAQWDGETFVSAFAFSESKDFVGLCRKIGYTSRPNGDKLTIFSTAEKRVVYNMDFTCSGTALALSNDGSRLAAEYYYQADSGNIGVRVTVLDTAPPYKREKFDLNASFFRYAIAFTPDDAMLAVRCSELEICFMDPATSGVLQRLTAHSQITNLAFSKDGSLLATSSSWNLISLWAVPPFTNNPVK